MHIQVNINDMNDKQCLYCILLIFIIYYIHFIKFLDMQNQKKRSYPSDSLKRKRKAEQEKRVQKLPKIEHFFSKNETNPTSSEEQEILVDFSNGNSNSENDKDEDEKAFRKFSNTEVAGNGADRNENLNGQNLIFDLHSNHEDENNSSNILGSDEVACSIESRRNRCNDVGLWHILSPEDINYWIFTGPSNCQHAMEEFTN